MERSLIWTKDRAVHVMSHYDVVHYDLKTDKIDLGDLIMANELRQALSSQDPWRIAKALELPSLSKIKREGLPSKHNERLTIGTTDWSAVFNSYLDACDAAKFGDVEQFYQAQSAVHAAFNHIFGSSPGNLLVPALHTICRNTHFAASAADQASTRDHSKMQNAVNLLQESFSRCLNDRKEHSPGAPLSEDGSKKAGVLYVVNQLFAMYFKLNTLRLCKNLLRPVESRGLHLSGDMGDMVTYRFFVGRIHMYEDQYQLAEANLDYAFKHCHKSALKNKKRILRYLVPVKMLRGRLPTSTLLNKYELHEFRPLTDSIRTGDLRTFNDGLVKHQDLFIRRGIYLLLEKCKTVCHRNLFKRVHMILGKPHLSLPHLEKALKWLGIPMDNDEIECILANLIYRGFIRGYISHAKRTLVLSKSNPFPTSAVIVSSN